MNITVCATPIGNLRLTQDKGALVCVELTDEVPTETDDPVLLCAKRELDEYFAGRRTDFTVPLFLSGTSFQKRIWNALLTVPYGETVSYGEIARRAGMPTAVRAAATAIGHNPLMILIPCHRVIRGDGSIGGFAVGTAIKQQLLAIEGVIV